MPIPITHNGCAPTRSESGARCVLCFRGHEQLDKLVNARTSPLAQLRAFPLANLAPTMRRCLRWSVWDGKQGVRGNNYPAMSSLNRNPMFWAGAMSKCRSVTCASAEMLSDSMALDSSPWPRSWPNWAPRAASAQSSTRSWSDMPPSTPRASRQSTATVSGQSRYGRCGRER